MTNRITGLNSGLDTESLITALTQNYQTRVDKQKGGQTKLSWKQETWKTTNKSIVSFYNGSLGNMRLSDAYNKKTTKSSNEKALSVVTGSNAMNAVQTVSKTKMAKSTFLTGNKLSVTKDGKKENPTADTTLSELGITSDVTLKFKMGKNGDELNIDISASDTISSLVSKLNDAAVEIEVDENEKSSDIFSDSKTRGLGLTASFDAGNGRLFLTSEKTGTENAFAIDSSDFETWDAFKKLGLVDLEKEEQLQAAEDSEIVLNGVSYTSSSNTMTINGLTMTIGEDTDTAFTITTENDTSGIYDMVKDFLSDYNKLIKNLDTMYNADNARKYDMLTDDQKDQMSEEDIKNWNDKIKSGLLSHDNTLRNIIQTIKDAMGKSYAFSGITTDDARTSTEHQFGTLAMFGINTSSYFNSEENERGMYHIDGDEDDEKTQGNADKLKAAIAENPEYVSNFFQNLTRNVYKALGDLMKRSEYSSAYTVYEDKLMASQYSDYNSNISDAEKELERQQDYYYDKFAAMETALSKLNSSQSALSGMLGMG